MFVTERLILEEGNIENWIDETRNNIRQFLDTDERFRDKDLYVEITYESDCYNTDTNCMWHEIDIIITNYDVMIPMGGMHEGESRFAMSCLQFTTDNYAPQLVYKDGEFKFYYVFDLGAEGITDVITFENNEKNGRFETIIKKEVLGM